MAGLRSCCVTGHIATGTPTGTEGRLAGVAAYLAKPTAAQPPKKAVVLFSDVFGYDFVNTQLIADSFAREGGFLAVVPDMFNKTALQPWIMEEMMSVMGWGRPAPSGFLAGLLRKLQAVLTVFKVLPFFLPFAVRHFPPTKKAALADAVIDDLKAEHGIEKVAVIGYCFGGGQCLHLAKQEGKIDAFATNHTTVKVPDDITPLKTPGLFVCAENDMSFPEPAVKQAEELLAKRTDLKFQLQRYPGTFHGFAVRGDETNETVRAAKEDAFQRALAFFTEALA